MDWYRRYVLSWEFSNTLTVSFCLTALECALSITKPEIFNSDQGVQCTSHALTAQLEGRGYGSAGKGVDESLTISLCGGYGGPSGIA